MSRRAAALPLLSLALLLAGAAPPTEQRGHPDAGPNPSADACETCHRQATPEVFREWEGGPHGLVLVKCFVCHGSTGKDFTAAPDTRRCQGCHPAEAAAAVAAHAATGAPAQSGCFSCHAPHTLAAAGRPNPHAQ
jgi:hypothetical protein